MAFDTAEYVGKYAMVRSRGAFFHTEKSISTTVVRSAGCASAPRIGIMISSPIFQPPENAKAGT